MYSQFTAIAAGDLLANQKFSFEDTRNATVFHALGIAHAYTDTVITLSHGTQFIMPSRNALYLVTEPTNE